MYASLSGFYWNVNVPSSTDHECHRSKIGWGGKVLYQHPSLELLALTGPGREEQRLRNKRRCVLLSEREGVPSCQREP